MKNTGLELQLNTVNINRRDWNWTISFSYAYNRNEILELNGGSEYQLNKAIDGNMSPVLNLLQKYSKGDGRLESR